MTVLAIIVEVAKKGLMIAMAFATVIKRRRRLEDFKTVKVPVLIPLAEDDIPTAQQRFDQHPTIMG